MNIAITSQNFRTITGHAGKSRRFLVYSRTGDGQWQESERLDLPKEMSMQEFKGGIHPIDGIDVLITESCGNGFIRKMSARGIIVLKTSETNPETAINAYTTGQPLPPASPHEH